MDVGNYLAFKKSQEAMEKWASPPTVEILSEDISVGRVKKILFYQAENPQKGEIKELSILMLDPGSKILPHKHTEDSEVYIYSDTIAICEAGRWHSLVNDTEDVLIVVSVKNKA